MLHLETEFLLPRENLQAFQLCEVHHIVKDSLLFNVHKF